MIKTIEWLIFLYLVGAGFIYFGVDKAIFSNRKRRQIQIRRRQAALGSQQNAVQKIVAQEYELISETNTTQTFYFVLLALGLAGAWLFGRLVYGDSVLTLCVAGIGLLFPHIYLLLQYNQKRRQKAERLESAMALITHEYIACYDIEKSIQNNVDVIEESGPFKEFLVDMKMVSPNIERNLRRLESKERNVFFSRWISQLILTQNDRTQIVNLMPILEDMNDAKLAQRHNDTEVAGAWRDYAIMLGLILLSPLIVRIVQYEWYLYLTDTLIGQILVILLLLSLIWSTGRAVRINQPITG